MESIAVRLHDVEAHILAKERDIVRLKALAEEIKAERKYCNHVFTKPMKNYEHEGGQCIHCDINEVYWACNKPVVKKVG